MDILKDFQRFNPRVEVWNYERFKKLETYSLNRDVEPRITKVSKALSEGYVPGHSLTQVGFVTKDFGKYKVGDLVCLDANTRKAIYLLDPSLIPPEFFVLIYDISSKEDADKCYYSIDNTNAAESNAEKITGIHGENGYKPKSKKIKKGQYKTAINNVMRYLVNPDMTPMKFKSLQEEINYFLPEIKYLDNLGLDFDRYSSNILSVLILLTKKYGTNNERLERLIYNYKTGTTKVNNESEMDGIHYVYNILYIEHINEWSLTGYKSVHELIHTILYCFDKFILGELLVKKEVNSTKVKLPSKNDLHKHYIRFSRSLTTPIEEFLEK